MTNYIYLNNKKIYFENIVGYGCSFMAGSESVDHELRPDMSFEEINKYKYDYECRNFFINFCSDIDCTEKRVNPEFCKYNEDGSRYMLDWDKLNSVAKSKSWFNLFGKNFDCTVTNNAKGGGSFEYMQFTHMTDVINNKISDNDLIVVGITSVNRWLRFDKMHPMNVLYGWPGIGWPTLPSGEVDEVFYKKYTNYIGSDINMMWDTIRTLYYFNSLKNQVIFVPQFVNYTNNNPVIENIKYTSFFDMWETITKKENFLPWHISFLSIEDFGYLPNNGKPKNFKMAGSHPNQEQHKQFAKLLFDYLTTPKES